MWLCVSNGGGQLSSFPSRTDGCYSAPIRRGSNYRHLCEKPFPTSSASQGPSSRLPWIAVPFVSQPVSSLALCPSLCSAFPELLLDFMYVHVHMYSSASPPAAEPQAHFPGELLVINLPSLFPVSSADLFRRHLSIAVNISHSLLRQKATQDTFSVEGY